MAAEGREPYQNNNYARRTSVGGRIGRGRLRTLPQHLVISESVHDTSPEIRTAPLPWSGTDRYGKVNFNKDVFAGTTINETNGGSSDVTDVDSDAETGTLVPPTTGTTAAVDPSPHELQLTDFSNHLGDSMDIDDPADSSISMAGPDAGAFCRMSPEEDVYGWDAVLNHKTTQPFGDLSNPYQQHRLASRSKRNLLHRVFSAGSTSARESPSNPPTSTWTDTTM